MEIIDYDGANFFRDSASTYGEIVPSDTLYSLIRDFVAEHPSDVELMLGVFMREKGMQLTATALSKVAADFLPKLYDELRNAKSDSPSLADLKTGDRFLSANLELKDHTIMECLVKETKDGFVKLVTSCDTLYQKTTWVHADNSNYPIVCVLERKSGALVSAIDGLVKGFVSLSPSLAFNNTMPPTKLIGLACDLELAWSGLKEEMGL